VDLVAADDPYRSDSVTAPATEFRRHECGPVHLLVAEPLEAAVLELGLLEVGSFAELQRQEAGGSGRATNTIRSLPGLSDRLQLRPFRHGGWLRPLTRDRLTSLERPISELTVNCRLAEAGAPVPRPVLVVGWRHGPGRWTAAVGTLHEEACSNGLQFLATDPAPERVLAAADAAGAALRRLHDAGCCHADLHLGNVLIREDGGAPRVIFVDLDRARFVQPVPARRRGKEILRLYRSLLKWGHANAAEPATTRRFLAAYCDGNRALRSELAATFARERLRIAAHRLGYRVGRIRRPGPSAQ
jgi:tRNA A-37 threonylcarbamoyl transferase component Bud32